MILVFIFADSLASARKAVEDSNYHSSPSEDKGRGSRYKKTNKKYEDTSSDENEGRRLKLPPLPTVPDGIYNLNENGTLEKLDKLHETESIGIALVSESSASRPDNISPSVVVEVK
ncbi:uncharacterized protein [Leptinotarsa decemlineata]|uniref:uncharacterized protein n=1 Tax=Leptinotarsa decemlineata TaxID=7539 RepID=UPI003D30BA34